MGRGESTRRRLKAQQRAEERKGKRVLAPDQKQTKKTPGGGLPQDMTRAMKKMLALKAAAAAHKSGGAATRPQQKQQRQQQQRQPQPARPQQQAEQQQQPAEQDAEPARGQEAPAAAQEQQQQDAPRGKQQQQGQQPAPLEGAFLFQQKRLKERKKAFLAKKKAKKAGKGGEPLLGETEAALVHRTAASKPAFGEQAYQPLKVQLKRKHWAGQQEEAGGGGSTRGSKRCTEIFNRQMEAARTAAAAAEAARDDSRGPQAAPQQRKVGGGKKAGSQGKQAGSQGKQAKPKAADEATRQQLIDAYRQQKLARLEADGKVPLLSATTQSLAELVRRDAGRSASFRQ